MNSELNDRAGGARRRDHRPRELDAAERRLANIVRVAAGVALGTMVMLWATGNASTDQAPEAPNPAAPPILGPLEMTRQAPAPAQTPSAPAEAPGIEPAVIGDDDRSRYGAAGDAGGGHALQSY